MNDEVARRFRRESAGRPIVLLIAGPTASGKSALALALAGKTKATIVNADSMQVYRDLRVITARPTLAEAAQAPHALFGVVDGAQNHSVARWLADVAPLLDDLRDAGRTPILVGGTGLYFLALTRGLSDIPETPEALRADLRSWAAGRPPAELHRRLLALDPETAARLRPSDPQRLLRALEVVEATGRGLATYHDARRPPPLGPGEWRGIFLDAERATLRARIDARFERMVETGAREEAAALAERGLDPALPIMRAHGVPGLIAHLRGETTLAEAVARGQRDTRQYARRQFTFARRQLPDFQWAGAEAAESLALAACRAVAP